ncbi:hypothetical protein L7F22_021308 [Adiantum nelumboides]|nr:hypothetical protein [Adiantum nelumboides]
MAEEDGGLSLSLSLNYGAGEICEESKKASLSLSLSLGRSKDNNLRVYACLPGGATWGASRAHWQCSLGASRAKAPGLEADGKVPRLEPDEGAEEAGDQQSRVEKRGAQQGGMATGAGGWHLGARGRAQEEGIRGNNDLQEIFMMAGLGVVAHDGFQVPSTSMKLKQRTLLDSFGKTKRQERDGRDKASTSQVMLEIFGTSSALEDLDEDVDIEDSSNVLQEDIELFGMSCAHPPSSNVETNASNNDTKKKFRKFREEWLHKYAFLKRVVIDDKEFMKCLWCEKYKQKGPWGKGKGCKTIQVSAIRKHKRSPEHRFATLKVLNEGGMKMQTHMEVLSSKVQRRVITCMKLMYFIAKEDLACKKYKKLCDLAYALDVQAMPVKNDYSAYTNVMAGKDFVSCISEYLQTIQLGQVKQSPFYSLMIDETTDRAMEKHLIIYIAFLSCAGLGVCKTQFARMVVVADGSAQTKYEALVKVLDEIGLDMQQMVGIATDGDSSMLGCHDGLVAKLRRKVPHLVSTHCIAHREALAILDATKCFPCLSYIDKVANKIYSWIHGSSLRHTGFQNLLNEMNLQVLEVLQIHDVRWLSRGNVMERLVVLMPAILTYWKEGAPAWYKKLRIYKVLFVIHLLADVLHDLNVLNKHFQEDNVDIASISAYIEVTLSSLRRKFLEDDFGKGTKFLKKFMSDTEDCSLRHVNESGVEFVHSLLYETIPGKDKDNEPLDRGSGDVESCKQLAINFVQKVIECINERFPYVYFLNATKLFSPQFYPKDDKRSKSSGEREKKVSAWLSRLLDKVGAQLVDAQGCEAELLAFTDTLYYACESMTMKDAWQLFASNINWQRTYPNLLKLWQLVLVLPVSSVSCERGFSKQNAIKTSTRQCLKVDTLESLMRISLVGPNKDAIDWMAVYKIWELKKCRNGKRGVFMTCSVSYLDLSFLLLHKVNENANCYTVIGV